MQTTGLFALSTLQRLHLCKQQSEFNMVAELNPKHRGAPVSSSKYYNNCSSNHAPNYYDMSGEAAPASAQQPTGTENRPTAGTVGATTTGAGTGQDNDVQRLHKYKLPPPFFTGDYCQYEELLFKLQAYLGLIDRDFDLVLQLAQVATRQVEDADIRAHIRDPTRASKAVDLARDLHYILINICQGAVATVARQTATTQMDVKHCGSYTTHSTYQ